jgi:hypothetical protein
MKSKMIPVRLRQTLTDGYPTDDRANAAGFLSQSIDMWL